MPDGNYLFNRYMLMASFVPGTGSPRQRHRTRGMEHTVFGTGRPSWTGAPHTANFLWGGPPGLSVPSIPPVGWVFFLLPFMTLLVRLQGSPQIPNYLLNLTVFSSNKATQGALSLEYTALCVSVDVCTHRHACAAGRAHSRFCTCDQLLWVREVFK